MSPKINFPNKKLVIKCPIILYKSGNLISEQKLYKKPDLDYHIDNGDEDEYGQIISFHPKCLVKNKNNIFLN